LTIEDILELNEETTEPNEKRKSSLSLAIDPRSETETMMHEPPKIEPD